MHDHFKRGVTTDGINPGGGVTAIVYESYLGENGIPKTQGLDLKPYFTKAFYERKVPVWVASKDDAIIGSWVGEPDDEVSGEVRTASMNLVAVGILVALAVLILGLSVFKHRRA